MNSYHAYDDNNEPIIPSEITDPRDAGECDPLYGQRMDSADLGQN